VLIKDGSKVKTGTQKYFMKKIKEWSNPENPFLRAQSSGHNSQVRYDYGTRRLRFRYEFTTTRYNTLRGI